MLNILVTGANGQLGNAMRQASAQTTNRYIYTDVAELDITDIATVRALAKRESVDVVVNCAAYTNVEKAEEDADVACLLNNTAVENLAIVTKEMGAILIHISTDYVFQGDMNQPYSEDEPTNPLGVYGRTKLAGEQAIKAVGGRYLIFRTAWLYSEFGNNFVKTMMRLTAERDSVNVVFDQVGTPTYAGDLAQLIVHIIDSGKYMNNNGIYHFSDEGVCSWYDLAHETALVAGNTRCEIRPCHSSEFPSKVKRPAFSVLDKSKVKTTFSIEIPHWRDSLIKCIDKLKN